jgi:hypothetical protein
MPKRATYYAFAIVAAGTIAVVSAALFWTCNDMNRFLACVCLALLGSTFKVKMPGMEGCISPNFVPILYAMGTMGWPETVVMAGVAGLAQSLWKTKRRPLVIQVLFNAANLALAAGAGFAISHAFTSGGSQLLMQLAAGVTVYEVLNTLSVSVVVCLATGSSLGNIWRNCHLWTFPYHLSGAALAALWTQSNATMSLSVTVFGALILFLMSAFYRELVKRTSPAESGVLTSS